MFSVVIISYRNPKYLDLCLDSLHKGQVRKNEVIVVLDGFGEESKEVLKKYPDIQVLDLPENKGQTYCHNTGVTLASNKWVLVVNDDNVFPAKWDSDLADGLQDDMVLSPNQVEPVPSIFSDFVIKDFGKSVDEFKYKDFIMWGSIKSAENMKNLTPEHYGLAGQTWPLCIQKKWYMILNGIDAGFPSPAVADWDFFMRCELAGLKCVRYFGTHFYHFAGAATKRSPEQAAKHKEGEQASYEYFKWKWGCYPVRDAIKNSCLHQKFRGI